jgi:hypothetical protein
LWERKFPKGGLILGFVEDDVARSDSLKAQFVGTVTIKSNQCTLTAFNNPAELKGLFLEYRYKLRFGYDNGKWRYIDGTRTLVDTDQYSFLRERIGTSHSVETIAGTYFAALYAD